MKLHSKPLSRDIWPWTALSGSIWRAPESFWQTFFMNADKDGLANMRCIGCRRSDHASEPYNKIIASSLKRLTTGAPDSSLKAASELQTCAAALLPKFASAWEPDCMCPHRLASYRRMPQPSYAMVASIVAIHLARFIILQVERNICHVNQLTQSNHVDMQTIYVSGITLNHTHIAQSHHSLVLSLVAGSTKHTKLDTRLQCQIRSRPMWLRAQTILAHESYTRT